MRAFVICFVAAAIGCSSHSKTDQKVQELRPPAVVAPTIRIEFGRCSGLEQAFISGARTPYRPTDQRRSGIVAVETSPDAAALDRPAFRCFQQAAAKRPGLSGKIRVRVDIAENGSVKSVKAVEGFDPKVDQCIVAAIGALSFSPAATSRVVSQSWVFRSHHALANTKAKLKRLDQTTSRLLAALDRPKFRVRPPAAPDYGTPLRPAQAAFEACAREHLNRERSFDAAVIDLAPSKTPVVSSALDNKKLASCLAEAATTISASGAMRCPLALGERAIDHGLVVFVQGDKIVYEGKTVTLNDLKQVLEARRATITEARSGAPVALMGPLVVRVRRADAIGKTLEVIDTAGTAEFFVALAIEDGNGWTLIRGMPLPWVPVHGSRTDQPELVLRLERAGPANIAAIETKIQNADRQSIVEIAIDAQLLFGDVLPVLVALRSAGLDDWRLRSLE